MTSVSVSSKVSCIVYWHLLFYGRSPVHLKNCKSTSNVNIKTSTETCIGIYYKIMTIENMAMNAELCWRSIICEEKEGSLTQFVN
jgi:hypothetical protein